MGCSKHELRTINMLHSLKKIAILHPYLPITATSPLRPLSSAPKVAVVEWFVCIRKLLVLVYSGDLDDFPDFFL